MDLLIVGGSGFLGREAARQARAAGHTVTATFATRAGDLPGVRRAPLDLRRGEEITRMLGETRPDAVLNAAYRRGDRAVTADGAIRLARAVTRYGARLVHVSSDAVFSGAAVHYDESAPPDPLTPYGAAKAAAETAIRGCAPDAVSRHELGVLIAGREGLDPAALPAGRRADVGPPGPLDVRLDSTRTRRTVRTRLRGARTFLRRAE
ncbi:sugar nucleotide-binding protein [Streptomyces catenulae]|uniref:Sugar nucleotide-binding protein n=1 Tax=Streptomyces catenulae TaxID=66875 RepID=A0ABV2YXF1_9ACTN|nr:sugar nucleotide-binding protein [Streptomyces catenulae]